MAEPIEIIIKQGGTGGDGFGSGTGGAVGNKPSSAALSRGKGLFQEEDNLVANAVVDAQIVSALIGQVKSSISFGISSYGNMTGDYVGQQRMNETLSIIGDLTTIGLATWKFGSAGLIASGIVVTVNKGMQIINWKTDVAKQNTEASFARERSGNSLNNRSAGTYE